MYSPPYIGRADTILQPQMESSHNNHTHSSRHTFPSKWTPAAIQDGYWTATQRFLGATATTGSHQDNHLTTTTSGSSSTGVVRLSAASIHAWNKLLDTLRTPVPPSGRAENLNASLTQQNNMSLCVVMAHHSTASWISNERVPAHIAVPKSTRQIARVPPLRSVPEGTRVATNDNHQVTWL